MAPCRPCDFFYEIGGDIDQKGQPCTVVVGSRDVLDENRKRVSFVGGAYTIDGDKMKVEFTNSDHEVLEEHIVDLNV